ncbi:Uma2 family endonuclease [Streptomyces sporangiiformans]|uniref:Uma2 family endonuclease n=1 Tax=Streptomyces sporangiiformans TaxID=2315329 RepID=A0A505D2D4_9ACTN|nr:Uma2 family endonuclease [Streptomyces sporangiiformans]TPQ16987.1 Uma2 family endonuclease [Streptomyces sporangiiformans]
MSAAAVERATGNRPLTTLADEIMESRPGYRVEIIGDQILVTPSPDGAHACALTKLMRPFMLAGLDDGETRVVQNFSIWLPDGPEDYATPDLSVIDADYDEHHVEKNCYDPLVFRLVLEVTSSNWKTDLQTKVAAYADADVPVYVIIDRRHQRVHVLTSPTQDEYANHRVHAPGELVTLPDSIGAKVTLDVEQILKEGQSKRD